MSCKFSGGVILHYFCSPCPTHQSNGGCWRIFVLTHEVSIDTQEDEDHSFGVKNATMGEIFSCIFLGWGHIDKIRDEEMDMDKKQERLPSLKLT